MAFTLDDDKRCQLNEDIIKQLYLVAYMQGSKLPTSLVTNSKCSKVQVRGDGRTAVDMRSHVHQTVLPVVIKADHPIPVSCSVYYFEITVNVKSRSGLLALGVCSSRSSTNEWPGMEFTSYGYHSNSGTIYHNSKELPISAPSFGESDIIGCGVNFVNNSVFFTKNGVFVGPISAGKKLPHPVYPCIAFACPNCHVSVNFGHHKFAYNIGQYIARERAVAISTAVDRKCNDQLAYVTMRNLVATYLLHNGFLESAQALGEWVTKASIDSSTTTDENNEVTDNSDYNVHHNDNSSSNYDTNGKSPVKLSASETPNGSCPSSINKHMYQRDSITNFTNGTCHLDDDHNHSNHNTTNTDNTSFTLDELGGEQQSKLPTTTLTSQHYQSKTNLVKSSKDTILNDLFRWPEAVDILLRRRHLRETIRNGDYLSALDQLKTYFKTLWENDPSITFVLKCHHFIDLIRQHYTTNSSKEPSSLNGLSDNNNIDSNIRKTLQSNGLDTHRNSQKRVKPSSHSESSPEITTTPNKHDCQCKHLINSNHNHHSMNSELTAHTTIDVTNNTNNYIINRSSCLTSTTNNYNHSHNNSSDCQSPIRLRFNLPSNEWNNNGSLSPAISDQYSSEILPSVFPKNGPSANGTGVSLDCITNGNNNDDNSSAIICPVMFPVYAENNHIKDAFSLVAYQNPYKSPLSGLLHPKYRELLADAVNDAILVHLKQPCRPVLDIALTYLEHVLTDEGSSCKTTNNGSFGFYRFKSGQSNVSGLSVDPLQNRNATTRTTADDICLTSRTNHTPIHESTITPASRDTPTTPNRSIAIGIMHRDDIDDEPRHITTDVQTYALSLNEFNGSTNLLRPASTSIISSSLYVPPSALISLTGRNNNPITRSSDVQRSSLSTSRTRPTSLQNLIHQRHQSQLIDNQSTTTMTGTTTTAATTSSSTSSPSHFNRFLVTTASWPVSTSFSSSTSNNTTATTTITTTTTTQNLNRFSPSRITVTSSLTNTHAPTGPELAGFFHPILFIG
ncbi:unnamed protein product [Schistosoma rodhaini]|uniref:B30.2/SPRY domain-containing protein n=1 Tax=Schistosoma rodhaini TaxID=6188 RepID=A0AA85EQ52_9TREM|nr:unnamed protein product [Schistosoma rodhaini]CAH8682095.1 unnamed protein product [Schistosoma rodhaini]